MAAQRQKETCEKIARQKVFKTKSVSAICVGQESSPKFGDTKKDGEEGRGEGRGEKRKLKK